VSNGNNSPEIASGPLSIDSAAERLTGSILDSEPAATDDPDSEVEEAPEEEAEATTDDVTEEATQDAAEGDDGGEYEEAEEPDDDATEELRFDINGEEVTLQDISKGYLRLSDYTRKTQDLASQKKELEATKVSIAAERQHLKQMLEMAQTDATPETDWVQLATDDPLEYTRQRAIYDAAKTNREAMQAEAQRLAGVQRQEQTVNLQQHIAEQHDMLIQQIPEMGGENATQYQAGIRTFMEGLGYSNEELAQLFDHRIVMAFDALREKMQSNTSMAKKKVKGKPKVLKPGAKKSKGMAANKQRQQARAKLRESGSVDDAIALLMG
jgi:hypothetical protein